MQTEDYNASTDPIQIAAFNAANETLSRKSYQYDDIIDIRTENEKSGSN